MNSATSTEPVAWLDNGEVRAGSERQAHRVVTDEQKRDMPNAVKGSFNVPLYLHPDPSSAIIEELVGALEDVHKFSLVIDSAVRNYDPRSIAGGQYAEVATVLKQVRDLRRASTVGGEG